MMVIHFHKQASLRTFQISVSLSGLRGEGMRPVQTPRSGMGHARVKLL